MYEKEHNKLYSLLGKADKNKNKIINYIKNTGITPTILNMCHLYIYSDNLLKDIYLAISEDFKSIIKHNPSSIDDFKINDVFPFLSLDQKNLDMLEVLLPKIERLDPESSVDNYDMGWFLDSLIKNSPKGLGVVDQDNKMFELILSLPNFKLLDKHGFLYEDLIYNSIQEKAYINIKSIMSISPDNRKEECKGKLFKTLLENEDNKLINWVLGERLYPNQIDIASMCWIENANMSLIKSMNEIHPNPNLGVNLKVFYNHFNKIYSNDLSLEQINKIYEKFKKNILSNHIDIYFPDTTDFKEFLDIHLSLKFFPLFKVVDYFTDDLKSGSLKDIDRKKIECVYGMILNSLDKEYVENLYKEDRLYINFKNETIDYLDIKKNVESIQMRKISKKKKI